MGLKLKIKKNNAHAAPAHAGAAAAQGIAPAVAAPMPTAAVTTAPQLPIALKRDREPTDTGAPPVKKRLIKIKAKPTAPAVLSQPPPLAPVLAPTAPVLTPTALRPAAPVQPVKNHTQPSAAPPRKKIQIKKQLPAARMPHPHAHTVGGGAVGNALTTAVQPLKKKIKLKLAAKPARPAGNLEKKAIARAPLAVPPPIISAAAAVQPPLLTPQKSPLKLKLKPSAKKLKIKTPSKLGTGLSPAPVPAMKPAIMPMPQMGVKVKRKQKPEPKIQQKAQVLHRVALDPAMSARFCRWY